MVAKKRKLSKALACVNRKTKALKRQGKKVTKTARKQIGRQCAKKNPRKGRTTKTLPQTGKRKSIRQDRKRRAMRPGKRVSRTGRRYTETRRNRSDRRRKSGYI